MKSWIYIRNGVRIVLEDTRNGVKILLKEKKKCKEPFLFFAITRQGKARQGKARPEHCKDQTQLNYMTVRP
jgi:hypothetical protein